MRSVDPGGAPVGERGIAIELAQDEESPTGSLDNVTSGRISDAPRRAFTDNAGDLVVKRDEVRIQLAPANAIPDFEVQGACYRGRPRWRKDPPESSGGKYDICSVLAWGIRRVRQPLLQPATPSAGRSSPRPHPGPAQDYVRLP